MCRSRFHIANCALSYLAYVLAAAVWARLSLFHFLYQALYLHMLHIFVFSLYCMTYACYLHGSIIWPQTYGSFKIVCNLWNDKWFGKLSAVERTLSCRPAFSTNGHLPQVFRYSRHKLLKTYCYILLTCWYL